jgi:hypothetical protein
MKACIMLGHRALSNENEPYIYEPCISLDFLNSLIVKLLANLQTLVDPWQKTILLFIGLAYQGKDIVFRFIIEYTSLRDFGPLGT